MENKPRTGSSDGKLEIYLRLLGYLKPYRSKVFLGYSAMLLATLLNLFIPQVLKAAVDIGLANQELSALIAASALILVIGLIRIFAGFGQRYFGEWLTHRFAYDFRNRYYDSVQRLPFSFHNQAQTGDLMSRATSDISETERFIGIGLMDLVATISLIIGVTVAMFLLDAKLAAIALIPLPVLVVATLRFGSRIRPRFKSIQEQLGVLSTTMQESLTGIRVVKAFAREPHELSKFDQDNMAWFERRFIVIRMWANNWPFFTFTLAVSIFLLLWFGGSMAMDELITAGTLFAMITYVLMLNGPVQRLGFLVNLAATASAAAARVFEIIDTPNEVLEAPGAATVDPVSGAVQFQNVSFAYHEGRPILEDVSFDVKPGQNFALMGPTGTGKSTITNLIPRFYDATGGRILVDGLDVRDWKIRDLRRSVGIVLQDSFLFSSTIAENIAYGHPQASQEEIVESAKAAEAHDFIQSFPEGYNTVVG
ncbi:MAG: ABC transporter ATP-binding protein, partial [Candidatus Promineifilaceae bacterium]